MDKWELLVNCGVFVAELIVALVIYLEVTHSRNASFLEIATREQANKDRRKIYNEFLKLSGELNAMAETFCTMILKPENKKLKHACERQIALFNDLGFSCRKPFWGIFFVENALVSLLPHAAIYVWVILKPYVLKRRNETGPWYATPFLRFTVRSADFVLKYNRRLYFSVEEGGAGVEISVSQLEAMRDGIKAELEKKHSKE